MLILAGGRAMPDGREEPKAQALVGKRAGAGRGRRAQIVSDSFGRVAAESCGK